MIENLLKKGLWALPKRQIAHTGLDYVWDYAEKYFADLKVKNEAIRQNILNQEQERAKLREVLEKISKTL